MFVVWLQSFRRVVPNDLRLRLPSALSLATILLVLLTIASTTTALTTSTSWRRNFIRFYVFGGGFKVILGIKRYSPGSKPEPSLKKPKKFTLVATLSLVSLISTSLATSVTSSLLAIITTGSSASLITYRKEVSIFFPSKAEAKLTAGTATAASCTRTESLLNGCDRVLDIIITSSYFCRAVSFLKLTMYKKISTKSTKISQRHLLWKSRCARCIHSGVAEWLHLLGQ